MKYYNLLKAYQQLNICWKYGSMERVDTYKRRTYGRTEKNGEGFITR
jgi:hypothetical protein